MSENTETKAKTTTISHYAGTSAAMTWTSEGTEKWTRNIPGIDGSLSAIQESSGAIMLEIHDLQGNIVGKAALSETETKLISTYNSTEYGVPTTSNPPKYSWLGADGVASELSATGVSTQDGSTYVPEVGRPLQPGPIPSPGSFPNGTASVGVIEAPYLGASTAQLMSIALQQNAEREEAKKLETEEIAKMTSCPASECGPWPEEGESYEGEIGDPVPCNVYAFQPGQDEEVLGHHLEGFGAFECASVVPKVVFQVCLERLVKNKGSEQWINVGCNTAHLNDASVDEMSYATKCHVGSEYRTYAWLGVFGEAGIRKLSGPATCEENLAEEGLGIL